MTTITCEQASNAITIAQWLIANKHPFDYRLIANKVHRFSVNPYGSSESPSVAARCVKALTGGIEMHDIQPDL